MQRHIRRTVELEVSVALRQLLATLRARAGLVGPAQLDVDRVRDVEAAVECRLPDPVLALIAADLPLLRDSLDVALGRIVAHSARARESRARGDFVAFGADSDGHVFHGFLVGAPERVAVLDRHDRTLGSFTPVQWLRQRAELAEIELEPPAAPEFVVRLVRAGRPAPDGPRVRHRQWGIGHVLAEHGVGPDRKVKVSFPGHGLKTLSARFLEFLGEDAP